MHKHHEIIVTKILESISNQQDSRKKHHASRSDAMKRKINTLRKLNAVQAIEVLENIAQNDVDKNVMKTAGQAAMSLRRIKI